MIAHRRPEFVSVTVRKANDDTEGSDEVEFISCEEGTKVRYDFFGKSNNNRSGDSDVPSPRMWEQAGSPTARSPKTRQHQHQPTSRAQLIARYRQEMMDLVRDMSESDYEISLKDLIESPRRERAVEESPAKGVKRRKAQKSAPKKGTRRNPSRNESMNTAVFLLKLSFPFSVGGSRGRKSSRSSSVKCSNLSPNSIFGNEEKGSLEKKSTYGELCNRNKFGDKRSWSSGSSRKMSGCYSFFHI